MKALATPLSNLSKIPPMLHKLRIERQTNFNVKRGMNSDLKGFLQLQDIVRNFFQEREFFNVITPPVVENPGMETHLHPFSLYSVKDRKILPRCYLHTSPEFHMKELLSQGFNKIFTLSYVFRDEPPSAEHRFQFLMLEWYRTGVGYEQIMQDCKELLQATAKQLKDRGYPSRFDGKIGFKKKTVDNLFQEILGFSILNYLDSNRLRDLIAQKYPEVPLPINPHSSMNWEDYYFLLFLNKIEPALQNIPAILLYEFPHPLAALSNLKKTDNDVCQRFEIYLHGIELCNCFDELTDLATLKKRFEKQHQDKLQHHHYQLPSPTRFYQSMKKGIPPSSGIALGMERLYKGLTGVENPFWD